MANEINVQLKSYTLETQVTVGARGKSAYESWLDQGYVGSEADFITALLQDATFVFNQEVASNEWIITHNLNKFPSVTIIDSGDNVVFGDVQYLNSNSLKINFTAVFSGKVYLN
jgi:hypothetical protein